MASPKSAMEVAAKYGPIKASPQLEAILGEAAMSSKIAVGDWVRLKRGRRHSRIGRVMEVEPEPYPPTRSFYRLATDQAGDYRYRHWGKTGRETLGLLCVRDDFTVVRNAAAMPAHPYFPMRRKLPYGRYILADGGFVLFNRDYNPILQVAADGTRSPCEGSEWIECQAQQWFFNDRNPPWESRATFALAAAILDGKMPALADIVYEVHEDAA